MKVTESTLLEAVLDIFEKNGIYDDGGRMLLNDLRQDWADIGLRENDLGHAIRVGEECDFLKAVELDGERCVTLLSHTLPSSREQHNVLRRLLTGSNKVLTLARVKARNSTTATDAEGMRRRKRDKRKKPSED